MLEKYKAREAAPTPSASPNNRRTAEDFCRWTNPYPVILTYLTKPIIRQAAKK